MRQAKYVIAHLLHEDRPPVWTSATVYLRPQGRITFEMLFTPTSWTDRRVFGRPLLHVVNGHLSPIPMIVSLLVQEIEARGMQPTPTKNTESTRARGAHRLRQHFQRSGVPLVRTQAAWTRKVCTGSLVPRLPSTSCDALWTLAVRAVLLQVYGRVSGRPGCLTP